ncbi:hypothetical protein GGI35DRAFT_467542 [Trichoderma velutinum]
MHASLFIGFLLFATKVLAGGYAGALERVWLFYDYQIDGPNDPAQQTLGRKCMSWDDAAKCRINTKTKQECIDPDPEETAKKVYAHFLAQKKHKVPDWPGYRIIDQDSDDYNQSIDRGEDVVEKAAKAGKSMGDNKKLFERFAQTTSQIKTARVGDHGPYLINAAEKRLKPLGIDVVKENVGSSGHNPADPSKTWETVDWKRTMAGAIAGGEYSEQEIMAITDKMREDFYSDDDRTPRDHRTVIQSYEIVENKVNGCI